MLTRYITEPKIDDATTKAHPDLHSADRGRALLWALLAATGTLAFCINALRPAGGLVFIWGWAVGIPIFRLVSLADVLLSAFAFAMAARALVLARQSELTLQMARTSIDINLALAAAGNGDLAQLGKVAAALFRLGPRRMLRYLRYSRIVERACPRLRARLAGAL